MIFVCLLVDLIVGFVSYLTLENGGLNLASTIILVLQATRTLLCPVDFMGTSFETVFSTVVLDTISFLTDVSSITIMLASWKLNCFWIRRTCITYAAIRSFKYDGSFWAVVVFYLREKPCLRINFRKVFLPFSYTLWFHVKMRRSISIAVCVSLNNNLFCEFHTIRAFRKKSNLLLFQPLCHHMFYHSTSKY